MRRIVTCLFLEAVNTALEVAGQSVYAAFVVDPSHSQRKGTKMTSGVAEGLLRCLWFQEQKICGKSEGRGRPSQDGQNDGAKLSNGSSLSLR